jgi:putative PEP-CTERM system histidine kinase
MAVLLLGTTLRHRARRWIRQNVFAGRYDYREFWMGAAQSVRSTDSPQVASAALAQLIEKALGSLDVSVWLRARHSDKFLLQAARGGIAASLTADAPKLLDALSSIHEPISVSGLDESAKNKWPKGFLDQTKAALLAPLISSGRVIGLLTVGADRSGRAFDREARAFLRVLALHSASEFHKAELLSTLVAAREAEAFHTFSTFLLHDLKNFASTLSLIAKNAVRHHANPDFQRDAFQSIVNTSEKIKNICNSLRTFSSSLAMNKEVHDLNQIVKTVAETFNTGFSKQINLQLGDIPMVLVDREEMVRVLQNLILNAHEASNDGAIDFSTALENDTVVVEVRDHGRGIPRDFMENELFQPFHTTKVDGLGIGLFQSKRILEAHNGTIEVDSVEGKGTVVRVILPIVHDAGQNMRIAVRNEKEVLVKATNGGLTI